MRTADLATRKLKKQALELLEWALADMSPGDRPKHALRFKCGFEREGHFIPTDHLPHDIKHWHDRFDMKMKDYAQIAPAPHGSTKGDSADSYGITF